MRFVSASSGDLLGRGATVALRSSEPDRAFPAPKGSHLRPSILPEVFNRFDTAAVAVQSLQGQGWIGWEPVIRGGGSPA